MALLGYHEAEAAGRKVRLPVVSLGESIIPHSLRTRTHQGIGEFALVTPDDVRASPIHVHTPWGTFAVAADARRSIVHTGTWQGAGRVYLGRTVFNRVTEIRVTFDYDGTWAAIYCNAVHVFFDPLECAHIEVSVQAGAFTGSRQLYRSACGYHYGEFQANWVPVHTGGVAVISNLPPGQYDVWANVHAWLTKSGGDGQGLQGPYLKVTAWEERA